MRCYGYLPQLAFPELGGLAGEPPARRRSSARRRIGPEGGPHRSLPHMLRTPQFLFPLKTWVWKSMAADRRQFTCDTRLSVNGEKSASLCGFHCTYARVLHMASKQIFVVARVSMSLSVVKSSPGPRHGPRRLGASLIMRILARRLYQKRR